jgi:hypothetical protein
MNLRKRIFAVSAAAALAAVAPQAFADGKKDDGHRECSPEILSSSIHPTGAAVTAVSGVCLDLVDVASTSGPATIKTPKVEAWMDGDFVELTLAALPGNRYAKTAANVLETIALCSATTSGEGITTVRITRPYLTKSGKAKTTTEESQAAVSFKGGC